MHIPTNDDWVLFASRLRNGRKPCWGAAILRQYIQPAAKRPGIEKRIGWHTFSPHVFNSAQKSPGRIQGHAGVDEAFLAAINTRRIYASGRAGQTGCAGCGTFAALLTTQFGE
jgi:hypothetical protein